MHREFWMLEGETTQKKKKPKKLFSFTRNQPLPLAQDHLIPLFRQELSPPLFLAPADNGGSSRGRTPISSHPQLHQRRGIFPFLLLPHSSGQRPTSSCLSSFPWHTSFTSPPAATQKVRNPSFHLLCRATLETKTSHHLPPLLALGTKTRETPGWRGSWFSVSSPFSRASLPLPHSKSQHSPTVSAHSLAKTQKEPKRLPPPWGFFGSSSRQPRAWLLGGLRSPSQHLSLLLLFPSTRQPTQRQPSFPAPSPKHSRPSPPLTSPDLSLTETSRPPHQAPLFQPTEKLPSPGVLGCCFQNRAKDPPAISALHRRPLPTAPIFPSATASPLIAEHHNSRLQHFLPSATAPAPAPTPTRSAKRSEDRTAIPSPSQLHPADHIEPPRPQPPRHSRLICHLRKGENRSEADLKKEKIETDPKKERKIKINCLWCVRLLCRSPPA